MTRDDEAPDSPRGVRVTIVNGSVSVLLDDGRSPLDKLPSVTLSPAAALKLSWHLARMAWVAAADRRRRRQ